MVLNKKNLLPLWWVTAQSITHALTPACLGLHDREDLGASWCGSSGTFTASTEREEEKARLA